MFLITINLLVVITMPIIISARPSTSNPLSFEPQRIQPQSSYDSYAPPTSQQLPNYDLSYLPFRELSREINPPPATIGISKADPNYYQSPDDDLRPPSETVWNPDHDPIYYFDDDYGEDDWMRATSGEIPTNKHPKKYNTEVHGDKSKTPIVVVPKKTKDDLHRDLKMLDKHAKTVNRKIVLQMQNRKEEISQKRVDLGMASSSIANSVQTTVQNDQSVLNANDNPVIANGERLTFHTVGQDGPSSYQWGYDTGSGDNRQFRYEQKNNDGIVKGLYGYYTNGNLKMTNYASHPQFGYHAQGDFGKF